MKKNISSLVSTFSKTEICRNNFGIRAEFLSNLGKVGYPIVDGYFISSDFMKNLNNGKSVLTIPKKFLEFGTFYLRSSTEKKEWPGPDPFPYIGFNKDTITKFSKIYGKKNLSLIYINHLKNFGARVFDLDADFFEHIILKSAKRNNLKSIRSSNLRSINGIISEFEEYYRVSLGFAFPNDPLKQIHYALKTFVKEWQSPTSKILRNSLGANNDSYLGAIIQKMVFRNPNSNIMDLEIQFFDSNTGEEKINGRLIKIGNFNNSYKSFEGSSLKNLKGQKFEIGKPKFNLFSNTFF